MPDPQFGDPIVGPIILTQCENFFDIIVFQFVGHLLCGSIVGLILTSSKRIYATHHASRSTAARAPVLAAGNCSPVSLQETLRNTNAALAQSLLGYHESWCAQVFVLALQASLAGMRFGLNAFLPLLLSCWGFSFANGHGESFFGGMEHSSVSDFLIVCCNFGVLTEDEHASFYTTTCESPKDFKYYVE